MCLVWNWLSAVLELDHRDNNSSKHDDTDDSCNCKNRFLKCVNLLCVRTLGGKSILWCIACAASEYYGRADAIERQLQATKHGCQPIEAILGVSEGGFVNHGTTTSMLCPLNPATSREKGSPAGAGLGIVSVNACSAPWGISWVHVSTFSLTPSVTIFSPR